MLTAIRRPGLAHWPAPDYVYATYKAPDRPRKWRTSTATTTKTVKTIELKISATAIRRWCAPPVAAATSACAARCAPPRTRRTGAPPHRGPSTPPSCRRCFSGPAEQNKANVLLAELAGTNKLKTHTHIEHRLWAGIPLWRSTGSLSDYYLCPPIKWEMGI